MKYDLHIHTKYSPCSNNNPAVVLKLAKKKNLDGIAIADHHTLNGAIEVSKLNKDRDFEVIKACEISTNTGHVLGYYLNQPVKPGNTIEVIEQIKSQGGIAVHAHPLRINSFFKFLKHMPKINAIEGLNSRSLPFESMLAQSLAKKHNFAMTAGSDSHSWIELGSCYTEFDNDLGKALKLRKTKLHGSVIKGLLGFAYLRYHVLKNWIK